ICRRRRHGASLGRRRHRLGLGARRGVGGDARQGTPAPRRGRRSGARVKVATARLGVLDGGQPVFRADDEALLRGSAAFETLPVYAGRPFLLPEHVARLRNSIDALALPPLDEAELASLVAQLIDGDGVLRLFRTTHDLVVTFDALPAGLEDERA